MSKVSVLVIAAGEGRRFGAAKQFALLKGETLLDHCLGAFEMDGAVDEIILVLSDPGQLSSIKGNYRKISSVVKGGARRQDSVRNGFGELLALDEDIVLVHDGARPLVDGELINRVILEASRSGAAIPVLAMEDTVKEVRDGSVALTHDRSRLFRVQTPQGFRYGVLNKALEAAARDGFYGTDEAVLVERIGGRVNVVDGDSRNIKVTTPLDLRIAEALLGH
jgi:2-C-methyl-D-erythritol 4-phosphate cytidylyltransferase